MYSYSSVAFAGLGDFVGMDVGVVVGHKVGFGVGTFVVGRGVGLFVCGAFVGYLVLGQRHQRRRASVSHDRSKKMANVTKRTFFRKAGIFVINNNYIAEMESKDDMEVCLTLPQQEHHEDQILKRFKTMFKRRPFWIILALSAFLSAIVLPVMIANCHGITTETFELNGQVWTRRTFPYCFNEKPFTQVFVKDGCQIFEMKTPSVLNLIDVSECDNSYKSVSDVFDLVRNERNSNMTSFYVGVREPTETYTKCNVSECRLMQTPQIIRLPF